MARGKKVEREIETSDDPQRAAELARRAATARDRQRPSVIPERDLVQAND